MATQHSIVLTSALCRDTWPDNHGGDFWNTLNQPLELDRGLWTVALVEISYQPDSWYNVRHGNTVKISIHGFPTNILSRKTIFIHSIKVSEDYSDIMHI